MPFIRGPPRNVVSELTWSIANFRRATLLSLVKCGLIVLEDRTIKSFFIALYRIAMNILVAFPNF